MASNDGKDWARPNDQLQCEEREPSILESYYFDKSDMTESHTGTNNRNEENETDRAVLNRANIFIHVQQELPPEITALLPAGLRDILDLDSTAPKDNPIASTTTDGNDVKKASENKEPDILLQKASSLVSPYNECCGRLRHLSPEFEHRRNLYADVVSELAGTSTCKNLIITSCSENPWNPLLKPIIPYPTLGDPSTWPVLTPETIGMASPRRTPVNNIPTPQPPITVGISRFAFTESQGSVLYRWQENEIVSSDPYEIQTFLLFPFLIFETVGGKDIVNLVGAQNAAAGAGSCAVRLLRSLAAQADNIDDAPRLVFTFTAEGEVRELWVCYWLFDEDKDRTCYHMTCYHMTCLGVWSSTLERDTEEFLRAIAIILLYGVEEFLPKIKRILDRASSEAGPA
ncbi:hypothetical protein DM02DRAFT_687609 [Periconia macrospinosa]|uniref:DUF7924 domain-containing protein n=1 Tax=Periconia macrospinosa TaxID=97972 RepID=A0A2V1DED6_9PLEO|nr:hypothetical protein DM02DRAFT_687609 [Periconia macrospinosa]